MPNLEEQHPLLTKIKERMPGTTFDLKSFAAACKRYIGQKLIFHGKCQDHDNRKDELILLCTIEGMLIRDTELYITVSTSKTIGGTNLQLRSNKNKTWSCSLPYSDTASNYEGTIELC
jgi:hypothetical protein